MSFSVAFSGNLTVSAEDVQNGIVTGTSGEDDGQRRKTAKRTEKVLDRHLMVPKVKKERVRHLVVPKEETRHRVAVLKEKDGEENGEDAGQTPGKRQRR